MAKLDIFPLLEQQGKTKYWLYKQLGIFRLMLLI